MSGATPLAPSLGPLGASSMDVSKVFGCKPSALVPGAALSLGSSSSTSDGSFRSHHIGSGGSVCGLCKFPLHANQAYQEHPKWEGRPGASTLSIAGFGSIGFVRARGRSIGIPSCFGGLLCPCRREAWLVKTRCSGASLCSNPVWGRATHLLPSLGRPWHTTTIRFSPRGGPGGNPHLTQPRCRKGHFHRVPCWAVGLGTDAARAPGYARFVCVLGLGSSFVNTMQSTLGMPVCVRSSTRTQAAKGHSDHGTEAEKKLV